MPSTFREDTTSLPTATAVRPFSPARLPFFYGWAIIAAGTLGVVMSLPGQTIGVSVFTDFLVEVLALSRVQLSIAYLIGTVGSALILSYAGRLYDRYGSRVMAGAAAFGLGTVLVLLTRVDLAASALSRLLPGVASWVPGFALISLGFFGIRFFGQGVLTMSSNNMVVKWFNRRRGLAMGIVGTFMSLGFSAAPRLLHSLILRFGWRGAWIVCAVVIGGAFPLVVAALFRDNPEQCGLAPDGPLPAPRSRSPRWKRQASQPEVDYTLQEARRTLPFWIFAGVLFLLSLYSTGMMFHIVSIFEEAGMTREQAVSIFLPASVIAIGVRLIAGLISDFVKLKFLLIAVLCGVLLSTFSLISLAPGAALLGLIAGNGISGGMIGLLGVITWPQFYGRTHLGAITGFIMALQVAGSAVGPYAFSLALSFTGGYAAAAAGALVVAVGLLVAAFWAEQPDAAAAGDGELR